MARPENKVWHSENFFMLTLLWMDVQLLKEESQIIKKEWVKCNKSLKTSNLVKSLAMIIWKLY